MLHPDPPADGVLPPPGELWRLIKDFFGLRQPYPTRFPAGDLEPHHEVRDGEGMLEKDLPYRPILGRPVDLAARDPKDLD